MRDSGVLVQPRVCRRTAARPRARESQRNTVARHAGEKVSKVGDKNGETGGGVSTPHSRRAGRPEFSNLASRRFSLTQTVSFSVVSSIHQLLPSPLHTCLNLFLSASHPHIPFLHPTTLSFYPQSRPHAISAGAARSTRRARAACGLTSSVTSPDRICAAVTASLSRVSSAAARASSSRPRPANSASSVVGTWARAHPSRGCGARAGAR